MNYSVVFNLLMFLHQIVSLQTVSVPDDLLGPGQCPSGSFCVDTDYCGHAYYTTKSGLPFYCGPHYKIDSMICCVNIGPEKASEAPLPTGVEYEDDNLKITRAHRSNPNGTHGILDNEQVDDGEVDILTLPFKYENPLDNDSISALNGQDAESLVEEAIAKELNSVKLGAKVERTAELFQAEQGGQAEAEVAEVQEAEKVEAETSDQAEQGTEELEARAGPSMNDSPPTPYQYRPTPACACERGEKGDPGPKGDPGEPGKIIYIPVFQTPGNPQYSPPLPPTFGPGGPYGGNQFQNGPGSPDPIVIPYNVPVPPEASRPPPYGMPYPPPRPYNPYNPYNQPPQQQPPVYPNLIPVPLPTPVPMNTAQQGTPTVMSPPDNMSEHRVTRFASGLKRSKQHKRAD